MLEFETTRQGEPRQSRFNEAALSMLGLPIADKRTPLNAVAIGFVDYGFDLLHPCLRTPQGDASRFRFVWDQNQTPEAAHAADLDVTTISDWDGGFLDGAVRDAAVSGSRREFDALYDPHANSGRRISTADPAHGTLMASIAAGTTFAGFRSAAPNASLIGVQLALADTDWKEHDQRGQPTWLGVKLRQDTFWVGWRSYDDAPQIGNAIRYIYNRACRLNVDAVVINLSIGAWAGAHDGASRAEQAICHLQVKADAAWQRGIGPRTIIVAGAGNAGADEGHWSGTVTPATPQTFDWIMQRGDPTQNKLEIWYESAAALDVEVKLPDGTVLQIAPSRTQEIRDGATRIGIADHTFEARRKRSRVRVLLHPPLFSTALFDGANSTTRFEFTLRAHGQAAVTHAWIERDDGMRERSWLSPSHPTSSLCCLASARGALVVAGCDHHCQPEAGQPVILPASSLGPKPWSTGTLARVPHAVAPAHAIWGARSKSRGFAQTTGTSAAVALTSGVIAKALSQDIDCKLAGTEVQSDWDCRFGFGLLNLTTETATGAAK